MNRRPLAPLYLSTELARLGFEAAMMIAEANLVVAMRFWGMAGFWKVTPSERHRMVAEKTRAAQEAAVAAGRAMAVGRPPLAIAGAALEPVRSRTRDNVRRLARRGPKLPS